MEFSPLLLTLAALWWRRRTLQSKMIGDLKWDVGVHLVGGRCHIHKGGVIGEWKETVDCEPTGPTSSISVRAQTCS